MLSCFLCEFLNLCDEKQRAIFPLSYQQLTIRLIKGHLYQILHACHQTSHQALHSTQLAFSLPSRQHFVFLTRNTKRNIVNSVGGGGGRVHQRLRCTHISWLIIQQSRQQSFIYVPVPAGWLFWLKRGNNCKALVADEYSRDCTDFFFF